MYVLQLRIIERMFNIPFNNGMYVISHKDKT